MSLARRISTQLSVYSQTSRIKMFAASARLFACAGEVMLKRKTKSCPCCRAFKAGLGIFCSCLGLSSVR